MVGNSVTFIGRLTRDPEIKTIEGTESKYCNFCLARNRSYNKNKEHPESDFVDCIAWNKTAELVVNYFRKGSRIGVSGELQTKNSTDVNGVKRKYTTIVVNSIEFLDPKNNNDDQKSDSDDSANATPPASTVAPTSAPVADDSSYELPF